MKKGLFEELLESVKQGSGLSVSAAALLLISLHIFIAGQFLFLTSDHPCAKILVEH